MTVQNTSTTRFTNSRRVNGEGKIALDGHGRRRHGLGDEQVCYNAPKYNGYVDAVLTDFTITNIHRGGIDTGWFSVAEHGKGVDGNRTFYVKGDASYLNDVLVSEWWKDNA